MTDGIHDPAGPTSGDDSNRLAVALTAVDRVNATDPNKASFGDATGPKELVHADRMLHWVRVLTPEPSDAQLVAARAAHLRRWALPRTDYPEGRAGYLRWRTEQQRRHAAEVSDIVTAAGYSPDFASRVSEIIRKRNRTSDAEVQLHEDALCLVFLELQLADLAVQLGPDKTVDVLRKSIEKMSPLAIGIVPTLGLSDADMELVHRATAEPESSSP